MAEVTGITQSFKAGSILLYLFHICIDSEIVEE